MHKDIFEERFAEWSKYNQGKKNAAAEMDPSDVH
jgi:hypothetical protein